MTVPPKEPSMKQTIALVDDDRNILTSVSMTLEQEGFQVRTYTDGESALQGLTARPVDLAVLDIKMPRMDGMELLQRLRQRSSMPVIFLTSKDEEVDELMGLRLGADDYITKPFSQRLLIERIRALLRRNEASRAEGSGAAPGGVMVRGDLMLDETKHQCTWHGQDIQLTVTEFLLVKALAARPGMVKSRDQLIDAAYGENIYVDDRTIDSHVKRIRKKFRTVDDSVQPYRDALRHRLPLQGALSGAMPDGSTLLRAARRRRLAAAAVPRALGVAAAAPHPAGQCAAAGAAGGGAAVSRPVPERPAGSRGGGAARAGAHLRRRAGRERGAHDRPGQSQAGAGASRGRCCAA